MIKSITRVITALSFAVITLIPMSANAVTGTGTASLSISPSSGSYSAGTTFSITVRETSSEAVASVEADMTYDANVLQCNGVDGSSSAFVQAYQNSCGGGSVSIARGTQGTTVAPGTATVAMVSFTALNAGSTQIKFAASSDINNASVVSICNTTCSGATAGTFTVNAPVVPTPTPTPVTTTTPKPTTTPVPVSPITQDAPTDSIAPVPAAETAKTYLVSVFVRDNRGNNAQGASVTLNGKTATSDKNGKANFTAVKAGTYAVKATSGRLAVTGNIVVHTKNKTIQSFMVKLPHAKSNNRFGFLLGAGIIGTILGSGLLYVNRKRASDVVTEVKKAAGKKNTPRLATSKQ